ncbi:MAG TPA: hypothetical protein VNH38_02070 [Candidatus Dormibacteraeota bacterium]|nr:hypothetical protein [Candidatus Dormibacteraeota bacterium]
MNQQSLEGARSPEARGNLKAVLGKGAEGNARLTGNLGLLLLVLLAMEGFTILAIRPLLGAHVFLGMLLVPPVLLKIGSTIWRFARFYLGAPAYQRRGPPLLFMRLLGPLVIISTVVVIGTGIALVLGPPAWRLSLLFLHKASFILWFGLMSLHVLGHLLDVFQFGGRDWLSRGRDRLSGVGARQFAVAASLVIGTILGVLILPATNGWPVVGG